MTWLGIIAASCAIGSTWADVTSTRAARAVGAREAWWLWRLLGDGWDEGRWALGCAVAVLALYSGRTGAWVAILWSAAVIAVSARNWRNAKVGRERARGLA